MGKRPPIPPKLEREVRKAAYYGCVRCGCPIVRIHHIVPWHIVKKHEKDNLVALCPNCHDEVHTGTYIRAHLLEDIKNPFNKKTGSVSKNFGVGKLSDIEFYMGGNRSTNTPNILTVQGERLIYFNVDHEGNALLNAIFYDETGNLVAIIEDNMWTTFIRPDTWDISYKAGRLKINNKKKPVYLEFEAKNNTIVINGKMHYRGCTLEAKNEMLTINTPTVKDLHLINCSFSNCNTLISV